MKRTLMFVFMCIGGCALDSNGIAFVGAILMVLIPAIVLIADELKKNEPVAEICDDVLLDYATRNDMEA